MYVCTYVCMYICVCVFVLSSSISRCEGVDGCPVSTDACAHNVMKACWTL